MSSLSVAGSEGPGAGVADVMDGVGSDGVCCGGCVTGGKAEYGCQTPWGMAHCGSVDG